MKILSNDEYETLKRKSDCYDQVLSYHYWFSAYDFLNPVFGWILGKEPYNRWSMDALRSKFEHELKQYCGGTVPEKRLRIMELESTIVGMQESMRPLLKEWEKLKNS